MNFCVLLSMVVLQLTLVVDSVPLGPPGSEDPGQDFAVPYHTTNSFIMSKLKSFYSYLFNKPESEHEMGYTKVHVMGKHMYYTYTHEFTRSEGKPTDANGDVITDNAIMKQYLNKEDLKKYNEELQKNMENLKKNEEKCGKRMWEHVSGASLPEQSPTEPTTPKDDGIVKHVMRQIPILKRFVRSVHEEDINQAEDKNFEFREYMETPPLTLIGNFVKTYVNDKFKAAAKRVLGRSTSKISDNIKNELKTFGGKIGEKIVKAHGVVSDALSDATDKVYNGIKTVVVATGSRLGEVVIPETIRTLPWKDIRGKLGEKLVKLIVPERPEPGVKVAF